jgi:hypothetical protein
MSKLVDTYCLMDAARSERLAELYEDYPDDLVMAGKAWYLRNYAAKMRESVERGRREKEIQAEIEAKKPWSWWILDTLIWGFFVAFVLLYVLIVVAPMVGEILR